MSDMYITQAVGSRNYSLHWRDGHGTWAGNHSGGIPAHPTVLGYMVGNHSMMPAPNTPHFNWGIDFPGTVTASKYSTWATKGRAPDCTWITFCTSCCPPPGIGPDCCCVSNGSAATGAAGLGGLGGLPSISFTRQDVGIILRVTPQISESEWVTLDVYQEISEVKEGSSSDSAASGGPTTTKRSAETHVSVRSNQTVVIGGLMQEVETESESKVPVLGDIPLLGALFRNKRKTKRKTNLLIFLTPHVIDSPSDLQEIYRVKMLQREEFMRRFYGKSKAEQMAELDTLIRYSMNLPDRPSVYSDPAPAAARYNDKVRLEDEELLEVNEVQLEILDDEELLEAIENLENTNDATLITPEGEVQFESSEDEASEDEATPEAPAGEEEQ